ncbi:MAG: HAD family hydrolase [Verrucomicrobiales bacterium]|nr:HAD family hydrolase [Verrucomicrobiales bacterium]|tara:strand:- start:755 stop:1300 length:546 start_codon:yes stop_codon:yes gene_type:complete
MNRAVFLDRDGTLNVERHYLDDPDAVEIFPGTGATLRRLMDAGFPLFIVTNQSGIGRGYYTEDDMHAVNTRLAEMLASDGVRFEKIYFAPESPEAESPGRKPSPKFLLDAAAEFGVDLARSYMIGDKLLDLQCGWNAGVKQSILVRTGYGAEHERDHPETAGAVVVDGLPEAVEWIVADSR